MQAGTCPRGNRLLRMNPACSCQQKHGLGVTGMGIAHYSHPCQSKSLTGRAREKAASPAMPCHALTYLASRHHSEAPLPAPFGRC